MSNFKEKLNSPSALKAISYLSYFAVCLSIVAKDYFSISSSVNTLPYFGFGISLDGVDPTFVTVLTFAIHSLLVGLWVEFLSRFVCNSIMRVSFSEINKYKFIANFKGVIVIVNLLLSFFNFMYFYMPFTFSLQPVIEVVSLTITFAIMFMVYRKKYLNQKSAPVIFLSFVIPLGLYFILIAI